MCGDELRMLIRAVSPPYSGAMCTSLRPCTIVADCVAGGDLLGEGWRPRPHYWHGARSCIITPATSRQMGKKSVVKMASTIEFFPQIPECCLDVTGVMMLLPVKCWQHGLGFPCSPGRSPPSPTIYQERRSNPSACWGNGDQLSKAMHVLSLREKSCRFIHVGILLFYEA